MSRAKMIKVVNFTVISNPEPGGSKRAFAVHRGSKTLGTRVPTGKVAIVETNKAVPLWREAVQHAARPGGHPLVSPALSGPLVVRFMFSLHRPPSVPVRKRPYPSVRPDCSKLVRPTEDAITDAGIWSDDALIVSEIVSKAYVGHWHPDGTAAMQVPGCVVEIFMIIL